MKTIACFYITQLLLFSYIAYNSFIIHDVIVNERYFSFIYFFLLYSAILYWYLKSKGSFVETFSYWLIEYLILIPLSVVNIIYGCEGIYCIVTDKYSLLLFLTINVVALYGYCRIGYLYLKLVTVKLGRRKKWYFFPLFLMLSFLLLDIL